MTAFVYPHGRDEFAKGNIDWEGDSFLVLLLEGYTLDTAAENRDDLTGVVASASLSGMAVVGNGVCDADDVAVSGLAAGETAEVVVICKDTGAAATDTLIYGADVHTDGTQIDRPGDGNPVNVVWSNGAGRIFQI